MSTPESRRHKNNHYSKFNSEETYPCSQKDKSYIN